MGSNKTKKFKDGYYFRVAHPLESIEKGRFDSMVIVKDGKIYSLYNCITKSWEEGVPDGYSIGLTASRYEKVTTFKLEFMGDL